MLTHYRLRSFFSSLLDTALEGCRAGQGLGPCVVLFPRGTARSPRRAASAVGIRKPGRPPHAAIASAAASKEEAIPPWPFGPRARQRDGTRLHRDPTKRRVQEERIAATDAGFLLYVVLRQLADYQRSHPDAAGEALIVAGDLQAQTARALGSSSDGNEYDAWLETYTAEYNLVSVGPVEATYYDGAGAATAIDHWLADAGLLACGKHFPGHGDTTQVLHMILTTKTKSKGIRYYQSLILQKNFLEKNFITYTKWILLLGFIL